MHNQLQSISTILNTKDAFDTINKDAIIEAISIPIQAWLDKDISTLIQCLYQLDIDESQVNIILKQGTNISKKIATLIYERQLIKYYNRMHNPAEYPDKDDELSW